MKTLGSTVLIILKFLGRKSLSVIILKNLLKHKSLLLRSNTSFFSFESLHSLFNNLILFSRSSISQKKIDDLSQTNINSHSTIFPKNKKYCNLLDSFLLCNKLFFSSKFSISQEKKKKSKNKWAIFSNRNKYDPPPKKKNKKIAIYCSHFPFLILLNLYFVFLIN